jgi:hypothetical protein
MQLLGTQGHESRHEAGAGKGNTVTQIRVKVPSRTGFDQRRDNVGEVGGRS